MPVSLHLLHVLSWRTYDKSVLGDKDQNRKPRAVMLQCDGYQLLLEHGMTGLLCPYGALFVYVASFE